MHELNEINSQFPSLRAQILVGNINTKQLLFLEKNIVSALHNQLANCLIPHYSYKNKFLQK
jgi:hypothetical protein